MGRDLFPFTSCRDLLAKAIHETLSQHAVKLRSLENRKNVCAIALNIDAWQFGRISLAVRIDDDESKTENDPGEWILSGLMNSCNSPALQAAGEELEKLGEKFGEQLGSSELGFIIAWAGAEALLERANVVMMKHLGFAAFHAEDRFAGNNFVYHLWHEFGSSGRMNFCNLVLARPLAARLLHGKAMAPPPDNPPRWNRPALEDLHGIQPLVPPTSFNFRGGTPGTIYLHAGKDGKSMVWWAEEGSDECRDIERFIAAGRWRAWRTPEDLAALVSAQPGKYVLRLNGVGTLPLNRHYYLSPEPEPAPDEYHCTTTKNPAEAPTFESVEEIVRMTLDLTAATKAYEDEEEKESDETESPAPENTAYENTAHETAEVTAEASAAPEAAVIEVEEVAELEYLDDESLEQDSEDADPQHEDSEHENTQKEDSEEAEAEEAEAEDDESADEAEEVDPDDQLPVMYWEPVLLTWAIEQEAAWDEFEREDLEFCQMADEEAASRGLKNEEPSANDQEEEDGEEAEDDALEADGSEEEDDE